MRGGGGRKEGREDQVDLGTCCTLSPAVREYHGTEHYLEASPQRASQRGPRGLKAQQRGLEYQQHAHRPVVHKKKNTEPKTRASVALVASLSNNGKPIWQIVVFMGQLGIAMQHCGQH